MLLPKLLTLTLAVAPALVSAALFPKESLVKVIDAKGFKKAMKENQTSVVAFVAPWCGHCQKMAPEYSKAALGLYPLVPTYAVDCDKQSNKKLCAEQGVQGFPTIKLFPRGGHSKPIDFDGPQRSGSAFYYWATRNIPHGVKKVYKYEDIPGWVEENKDKPRALLLNQGKHIPLLWQTLGNKYKDNIKFSVHRDRHGRSSVKMGLEKGDKGSSKVLIYPEGSSDYVLYEGIQKFDSLSKFFDSVIDGTADLRIVNAEAANEEFVPDDTELEIERKQEAQRMALAHGGFSEMIDFEEAVKAGHGADFHAKNGYPGMMGGLPKKHGAKKEEDEVQEVQEEKVEDPIHRILKAQKEAAERSARAPKMAKTGDGGEQVVFKVPTDTVQPRTPVASGTPALVQDDETPSPQAQETVASADPPVQVDETARAKDEL